MIAVRNCDLLEIFNKLSDRYSRKNHYFWVECSIFQITVVEKLGIFLVEFCQFISYTTCQITNTINKLIIQSIQSNHFQPTNPTNQTEENSNY